LKLAGINLQISVKETYKMYMKYMQRIVIKFHENYKFKIRECSALNFKLHFTYQFFWIALHISLTKK
jgi:hypothetical protein